MLKLVKEIWYMNYLLNELLRFEDPFFGLTTIKNESKYLLTDIKET